jgi:FKBP-type peptidyl-prolyl cis-trans isomerase 2
MGYLPVLAKKGVDIISIKKGDKIKVEYKGTLDDGTVFDSSENHEEPLEFEVGCGQIIPGFEEAIIGMEVGEEKDFKIQPKDAYGETDPNLVHEVPKDQIPIEQLEPGMILSLTLPNGAQIPARIVEVTDKNVKIDLNHPLAGQVLNFNVKILEIAA